MPTTSLKSASTDRNSFYQEITDRIICELEAGRVPWAQPWDAADPSVQVVLPRNAATRRAYSGINILILWDAALCGGFARSEWLTFRQALALGGHVAKGARGRTVVYADRFTPGRERERAATSGDDARTIPFLKRFTVFNIAQCEGLPDALTLPPEPPRADLIEPTADALIKATLADLRIGGDRAFYAPAYDCIQIPPPQAFHEPINWHRTAFHELGHWTGHRSRLGRDLTGSFGSSSYAREELVAEMAGAFVCAALGIVPTVRHADYLASWLEVLRDDDRAIVRAASAASKAADFILAFQAPDDGVPVEPASGALDAAA